MSVMNYCQICPDQSSIQLNLEEFGLNAFHILKCREDWWCDNSLIFVEDNFRDITINYKAYDDTRINHWTLIILGNVLCWDKSIDDFGLMFTWHYCPLLIMNDRFSFLQWKPSKINRFEYIFWILFCPQNQWSLPF